jgi:hypothetical protein
MWEHSGLIMYRKENSYLAGKSSNMLKSDPPVACNKWRWQVWKKKCPKLIFFVFSGVYVWAEEVQQ